VVVQLIEDKTASDLYPREGNYAHKHSWGTLMRFVERE